MGLTEYVCFIYKMNIRMHGSILLIGLSTIGKMHGNILLIGLWTIGNCRLYSTDRTIDYWQDAWRYSDGRTLDYW